jgi:phosphate transport system permease protein
MNSSPVTPANSPKQSQLGPVAASRARRILSPKQWEKIGFGALGIISLMAVLPIILLVVYIIIRGLPAISWEFLTSFPSNGMRSGGILPAIVGTIILTIGTAIVAVPLGVAAGIYLAEYAPDNRWTRAIRIAIINLAGIPSVVYGLFGLGLFVLFLNFGTSILASSLTLGIMTLPVIIKQCEQCPIRFGWWQSHWARRNGRASGGSFYPRGCRE